MLQRRIMQQHYWSVSVQPHTQEMWNVMPCGLKVNGKMQLCVMHYNTQTQVPIGLWEMANLVNVVPFLLYNLD